MAVNARVEGTPIVFLHGVFFDKSLWEDFGSNLTNRPHVYVDMPAHGRSSDVGRDWHLDECVDMLKQVLDALNIKRCIVVGHSWGSMTALRAAVRSPDRFEALCLLNMPFKRVTGLSRFGFQLQKPLARFQRFYAKQAASSLYSKAFLKANPERSSQMQERLAARSGKEIARVIDAVLLGPHDADELVAQLSVPALYVVGESDYVGIPQEVQSVTVPGGHISPHEAPAETRQAIKRVIELAEKRA